MAQAPQQVPAHHNSPVPPAVRKAAEKAERLQRESLGIAPDPQPDPTPEPQPDPAPAPAAQPGTPGTPAAPAAPPAPDLEAQLRTTQGRLDAERERTTTLAGQVDSLNRMVRELQEGQRQPPAQVPAIEPRITKQMEEDYGADLIAAMRAAAAEEYGPVIADLKAQVQNLQAGVQATAGAVQERGKKDALTILAEKVPNWVQQNDDPGFVAWLKLPDPYSGIIRHNLLLDAFDRQDADRMIKFFQGYLNEVAATGGSPQPGQQPAPGLQPPGGKVPLESFAAPGKATPSAAAPGPGGEKPNYTRAQIAQFFTDVSAGKWRGREADAALVEADIFRAQHEGRVSG